MADTVLYDAVLVDVQIYCFLIICKHHLVIMYRHAQDEWILKLLDLVLVFLK